MVLNKLIKKINYFYNPGHGMCIMELCLCQANFEGFSCEIEITQQEKIDCHNNCIKKCINEDLNIFTCLDACFKQYKNYFINK